MKTNYGGPLIPQIEENIQKVKWVAKDDIPALFDNAYENIKIVVNEVISKS
jgi:hypothetical protein